MKRLKYFFLILFSFVLITTVQADENSPIYVHIFKSSTCPHCAEALEFFDRLSEDAEYGKYFQLVSYETYGQTDEIRDNVSLAEKVAKYFGTEFEGVPLIVIGDKKFDGYATSLDDSLKERIKTCYEEQCEDIVVGIQDGTLKGKPFDMAIPSLIFVIVVGGISYLIVLCRKPVMEAEEVEKENDNVLLVESDDEDEKTQKNEQMEEKVSKIATAKKKTTHSNRKTKSEVTKKKSSSNTKKKNL